MWGRLLILALQAVGQQRHHCLSLSPESMAIITQWITDHGSPY